jgi:hypothetical protein
MGAVIDHVNAHSRGGPNAAENFATACNKCNANKSNAPRRASLKDAWRDELFAYMGGIVRNLGGKARLLPDAVGLRPDRLRPVLGENSFRLRPLQQPFSGALAARPGSPLQPPVILGRESRPCPGKRSAADEKSERTKPIFPLFSTPGKKTNPMESRSPITKPELESPNCRTRTVKPEL